MKYAGLVSCQKLKLKEVKYMRLKHYLRNKYSFLAFFRLIVYAVCYKLNIHNFFPINKI
jgi:hypothetical protein